MMELGRMQTLEVMKVKDFGVYLAESERCSDPLEKGVLLPKKQVPEGTENGSKL